MALKRRRVNAKKKRITKLRARVLLSKLRKNPDSISDHSLGQLILRTDAKTKKETLKILKIDD